MVEYLAWLSFLVPLVLIAVVARRILRITSRFADPEKLAASLTVEVTDALRNAGIDAEVVVSRDGEADPDSLRDLGFAAGRTPVQPDLPDAIDAPSRERSRVYWAVGAALLIAALTVALEISG